MVSALDVPAKVEAMAGVEAPLIAAAGVFIEHIGEADATEHICRRDAEKYAPSTGQAKNSVDHYRARHVDLQPFAASFSEFCCMSKEKDRTFLSVLYTLRRNSS
jgi:hypothetical protein